LNSQTLIGVDATTVARVLNLSVSRVHALAKEPGFPPKLAPGRFDLQKALLWYVRYLQAELVRRGPSGGAETAGILAERLRLLKAQAEKAEMENAIQRGEYLNAQVVGNAWGKMATNTRTRLLLIPSKVSPLLINRSELGQIAEIVRREIYLALTALANGDGERDDVPAEVDIP
jgi:phage terminase Nu1 subunit (DNA packaging protein)